ncbi:sensor histidine kinase [Tropicibacter oceani]|uniref:histidine kinase n=1 Tax=Tropicibacter oceani TaxID=3058420 RepID=A0ABY8QLX0_9RHOB|nr:HAMP domain-containing sensor histidine kinase [Tropicibacter oceani]WGW05559.1 HAMP domain-containing sensor histidine kinase [Tropicibacter oceani]
MTRRWRPSLGFVLGGGLLGTLVISLAGLVVFRYLGPAIGYKQAAVALGACIAAATGVLGWLLWRLLLRPILALQAYAAQVQSAPQDAARAPATFGTRELHAMAQSVMEMAQTLRDRETSMRSYSNHVTHEIKTPVAAIRAAVELLEDGQALSGEDRALVAQIGGAGRQIETQLEALRQIARAREPRHIGRTTLRQAIETLDAPALILAPEATSIDTALPISAEGLGLILGHLAGNAAAHGARRLDLAVADQGDALILTLQDDGPGISPGNRDRIFEPFFTTRRDQNGTGMGLAIVRAMLQAHRAEIALAPSQQGARFDIRFRRPGPS